VIYELSLPPARLYRTLKAMEVNFAPDLQARIDKLAVETSCAPEKLVEDAMAGYVAELAQTREMLDSRYDDLKSGRVKPIPGDEVIARLREKSAARRAQGS
jgi:predicted transcriptional regulator